MNRDLTQPCVTKGSEFDFVREVLLKHGLLSTDNANKQMRLGSSAVRMLNKILQIVIVKTNLRPNQSGAYLFYGHLTLRQQLHLQLALQLFLAKILMAQL
jgi:hypothetical protein